MRGLVYLIAFPFNFIGCLLTTLVFKLSWETFGFNLIIRDELHIPVADNLMNPSYWSCFWIFMAIGFLRIMFWPISDYGGVNSKKD